MSTCDPAFETCPPDNSTITEAPAFAAFNPLIYAWCVIQVLDFVAGLGNKHAWNSWLADSNKDAAAIFTAAGLPWEDFTWTSLSAGSG
jgi:hypothetical protein